MVIFVANVVLYIMAKQNVALAKENVELCDVASIYCEDETIRAKAETLKIHRFRQDSAPRVVVSILKIIEQLTKLCPGITVESIGETDIIIEKASLQHDKPQQKKSPWAYIKYYICHKNNHAFPKQTAICASYYMVIIYSFLIFIR